MTNYLSPVSAIDYDVDPAGTRVPNPQLRAGQILKIAGHVAGAGAAVTAAMQAGAGTSPPAAVVTNTNDTNGTVTFGTGTTPAAGDQIRLTFAASFGSAPKGVCITALNAATQALGLYVSAVTATTVTIAAANAPAASQANTVYSFSFIVLG